MIKVNDRVITIKDGEIRKGIVKTVYEGLGTAIVDFGEDKGFAKVYLDKLALDREPVAQEEPKRKTVEKSEITITPDEFKDISLDVVMELTEDKPFLSLAFTMFVATLGRALFMDEAEDDD